MISLSSTAHSEFATDVRNERTIGAAPHEPALQVLRSYAEFLEFPLACVDVHTSEVLARTHPELPFACPASVREQLPERRAARVLETSSGLLYFALPLPMFEGRIVAAVGYVLDHPQARPNDLVMCAAERNWSNAQLEQILQQIPWCPARVLKRMVEAAVAQASKETQETGLRREIDDLASQLEYTYEEISLLHALTQNLQISRAPSELAALGLERLHGLIRAEGHAIWLGDDTRDKPHFEVRGNLPFDELGLARLIARFESHDWSRPLVKNRVRGTLLGADHPGLHNFVIVSIAEGTHRSGWLISCNLSHGREFGTVEARLLGSVASILGTHGRNIELYRQHDELLLSFVRSLVSSLDAKDPYTRGHSERVALIARRLGETLQLPEEDLHDIYLSGLLHDIGKIGVDDEILRKPGQLTDAEFKQIQKHPIIGYGILAGIKNLQAIIPGVRHHHEAISGKGYPDGLAGEQIPLMARIIAVADSYDAMGSDRPYRKGMPLETLETILRRGAGEQWDVSVIDAYFKCRDEIRDLCRNYSTTTGNLLDVNDER